MCKSNRQGSTYCSAHALYIIALTSRPDVPAYMTGHHRHVASLTVLYRMIPYVIDSTVRSMSTSFMLGCPLFEFDTTKSRNQC